MNTQQLTGLCHSHITWLEDNLGVHQDMLPAWNAMSEAAKRDGFSLKIASGFRDFKRQLSIWNRKFVGELATKNAQNEMIDFQPLSDEEKVDAILLYSALPGTSRHHWGTDIDVYADNLLVDDQKLQLEPWEYEPNGPFEKLTQWLKVNSETFGFFFPYDQYRGGVAAEPWHLSFMPIAKDCLCKTNVESLSRVIKETDILGKDVILQKLPTIITQYVQNICPPNINDSKLNNIETRGNNVNHTTKTKAT
jgi:LAS superfamily LD-carboxypeptidase LdcB